MEIKIFDYLHEDAKYIREVVFVKEQGFVDEYDENDEISRHLVMYIDDAPVATCRFYLDAAGSGIEDSTNEYVLGRFAVMKDMRKGGLGKILMEHAEKHIRELGGNAVKIGAQLRAEGFYSKMGYKSNGERYFEQDCPHVKMRKTFC